MTPADRARKILLGTGMCLLFVFAVGLSSGRYSTSPEIGWVFPIIGILLVGIGIAKGSLGQQFPDAVPNSPNIPLEITVPLTSVIAHDTSPV